MRQTARMGRWWKSIAFLLALLVVGQARGRDETASRDTGPIDKGLRVFTCGHSFHVFVPGILADKAPGLTKQSDLFTDAIGHARAPLQALVAYCHFAVVYRRSPVGLPMPAVLRKAKKPEYDEKLNRLLQELAWEAVSGHPLSGVNAKVGG